MNAVVVSFIAIYLIQSLSGQKSSETDRKGCFFVNGYALGGTDKQVGFADSAQACLDLIRNIESAANGVTWESETQKCYAEFGATQIRPECRICVSCIYEEMHKGNVITITSPPIDNRRTIPERSTDWNGSFNEEEQNRNNDSPSLVLIDFTSLQGFRDKNKTPKLSSGVMEDAKWCIVANPDCSQDFTQKHCKSYCGLSEEPRTKDISNTIGRTEDSVQSDKDVKSKVDLYLSEANSKPLEADPSKL